MSDQNNPQLTQHVVNDIANTQLSSYQIAYKYHITKLTVDQIGRTHLGDAIYNQKEQLACQKLNAQILSLRGQGVSANKISEQLGVYKSTMFSLLKKATSEQITTPDDSNTVEVISIEQPNIGQESKSATELPQLEVHPTSPAENIAHNSKEQTPHHKCRPNRNHHNDFVKIQLKGIQITFNPQQENVNETISKILNALSS